MCGIAGILNLNGEPVSAGVLGRMTAIMAHRGPDGDGLHIDGCVGLGHRRLAILDLSSAGAQPMKTGDGRFALVFNGEIYNFQELRNELQKFGYAFRSTGDSEVLLQAYAHWGDETVNRLNGMFAFAVWDKVRRRLFLARDRYGVKPLYWFKNGEVFLFASEVKAILEHPAVRRSVCYQALDEYFTFQNIFSDRTLFEGVKLLQPGFSMTVEPRPADEPRQQRYWDLSLQAGGSMSEEKAAHSLHELFEEAVTRQLASDVPLDAYLSGGMDTGSITAVAVRKLPRLSTFTVGFDLSSASGLELGFDERANAERLANLFKTEHYEAVLHAGDMEWVLPKLVWHLEDLRVGQSYPNYYASRLCSKFVKVVLSGTGGDELFAGYPWRYYRALKGGGREAYLRAYYDFWQRLVPEQDKSRLYNAETAGKIEDKSAFEIFRSVFAGWQGGFESRDDLVNASLYFEFKTFLHGLLVVEDKLSMAHGLESRVPFLDNAIVDFASTIPVGLKLKEMERTVQIDENQLGKRLLHERELSNGKAVLRRAMSRIVPLEVTERKKQGFSAPDASWFRGESIDYINRLLRDPGARIYEFFKPGYVAEVLDQHCSGQVNRRLLIWSFLCFEWWCRKFLG
jgi:asparagine synthase (glutamine-hydrolysing)